MAPPPSSLQDLLSADGFKNRRRTAHRRPDAAPRAVSMPVDQPRTGQKPARSRSDVLARGRSSYAAVRSKRDDDEEAAEGSGGESSSGESGRGNGGRTGSCTVPALDEAALAALVSIATGAAKRFGRDEVFRASLRRGCAACLGESDHRAVLDFRVVAQDVERAAREGLGDPRELKRASMRLEAITAFHSKVDAHAVIAGGVPYSRLAACAHVYASALAKLQKEDRSSAEHALQAFCCAPREARTVLLPGLWERLLRPALSHLRSWYEKEAAEAAATEGTLETVDRTYREVLDMGAQELACYYRDWLQGRTEDTVLPLVPAPPAITRRVRGSRRTSYDIGSDVVFSSSSSANSSKSAPNRALQQPMDEEEIVDAEEEEETVGAEEEEETVDTQEEEIVVHEPDDEAKNSPKLQHELSTSHSTANETELILKKLAQEIFEPQVWNFPYQLFIRPLQKFAAKFLMLHTLHSQYKESHASRTATAQDLLALEFCAGPFRSSKDGSEVAIFSTTPEDFLCPLTRRVFADAATLETGQTFERAALRHWFGRGNRTCPVTGQELGSLSVPDTNRVLKHLIDGWSSEHCKNLAAIAGSIKCELDLSVAEQQLLTGSPERARHLMAAGGLDLLLRGFEAGDVEEKARVAELLLRCVEADGSCRSYLATRLRGECVLRLLHSGRDGARSAAVRLLAELLCLRRRATVQLFLSGLCTESIAETMHALLEHLHSSPPEEEALVAVLLLHFDLLIESQGNSSTYGEEAAKSITQALDCCLSEERVVANTRKALLLLGGRFSFAGDPLTEAWMLKKAGFDHAHPEDDDTVQEKETPEDESWLRNATVALLGSGATRRRFLEALSKCMNSADSELAKACLATAGWLSHSVASLDAADVQLAAFSALTPQLVQSLTSAQPIQHRVLACLCLHNFSRIPDCRALLMLLADGMRNQLNELGEFTWTAAQLCLQLAG